MTAPNHALLVTLLAVFTACVGYAVGRLHQWYRTGLDRDEAYRDGYETATRSVFSTAARLIAPRRSARGTASVTPAPAAPLTEPAASLPEPAALLPDPAALLPDPTASLPDPLALLPEPAASLPDPAALLPEPAAASPSRTVVSCATASRAEPAPAADDATGGRHLVPDELVQAPTYRLAPDRVARAKVREVAAEDEGQETTTRLPSVSVPRPRSS